MVHIKSILNAGKTQKNGKNPLFKRILPFLTADDRNRTCTSWTPDPKSGASANSAIPAQCIYFTNPAGRLSMPCRQHSVIRRAVASIKASVSSAGFFSWLCTSMPSITVSVSQARYSPSAPGLRAAIFCASTFLK